MPKVKIEHVISFSSEDPVHVANNILLENPAKKWKCKDPGERSATIVLQLEKACIISGIDIGNENSAYIEVLVSRVGSDNYKVLLVMSCFMKPLEARQGTGANKVRMFTQSDLSHPESEQKWDNIKIVCTQPFNQHAQFGLCFVNFHTPELNKGPKIKIGNFVIGPELKDDYQPGDIFWQLKREKADKLRAAAAIRKASNTPQTPKEKALTSKTTPAKCTPSTSTEKMPHRNRNELLYSKDEEGPNSKIDKIMNKKNSETKEQSESGKRKLDLGAHNKDSPKKKIKVDKPQKPFNKLLSGVVFIISGIENPERANVRTMALAMGAKYRPNWDSSCTHLISAFVKTPKFDHVKGKGIIVRKAWVEECFSQRKRLPWRRFWLDRDDSKAPESEEEIIEETVRKIDEPVANEDEDSGGADGFDDSKIQRRIDELLAAQKSNEPTDIYKEDTEEEIVDTNSTKILETLPEFFDGITFYLDEEMDKEIFEKIKRYIIAYKGTIVENPSEKNDLFICENCETLWDTYKNATFVHPYWVYYCHNLKAFEPLEGYTLTSERAPGIY